MPVSRGNRNVSSCTPSFLLAVIAPPMIILLGYCYMYSISGSYSIDEGPAIATSSTTYSRYFELILHLIALGFLFITLGITSSDFLCPNLAYLARIAKVSDKVAGMTLLALGNSAPDLLSTYLSFHGGLTTLALGELLGSAFLCVSVVVGLMGIIQPFSIVDDQVYEQEEREEEEAQQKIFQEEEGDGILNGVVDNLGATDSSILQKDHLGKQKQTWNNMRKKEFILDLMLFSVFVGAAIWFISDGKLTINECISMVLGYTIYLAYQIWTADNNPLVEVGETFPDIPTDIPTDIRIVNCGDELISISPHYRVSENNNEMKDVIHNIELPELDTNVMQEQISDQPTIHTQLISDSSNESYKAIESNRPPLGQKSQSFIDPQPLFLPRPSITKISSATNIRPKHLRVNTSVSSYAASRNDNMSTSLSPLTDSNYARNRLLIEARLLSRDHKLQQLPRNLRLSYIDILALSPNLGTNIPDHRFRDSNSDLDGLSPISYGMFSHSSESFSRRSPSPRCSLVDFNDEQEEESIKPNHKSARDGEQRRSFLLENFDDGNGESNKYTSVNEMSKASSKGFTTPEINVISPYTDERREEDEEEDDDEEEEKEEEENDEFPTTVMEFLLPFVRVLQKSDPTYEELWLFQKFLTGYLFYINIIPFFILAATVPCYNPENQITPNYASVHRKVLRIQLGVTPWLIGTGVWGSNFGKYEVLGMSFVSLINVICFSLWVNHGDMKEQCQTERDLEDGLMNNNDVKRVDIRGPSLISSKFYCGLTSFLGFFSSIIWISQVSALVIRILSRIGGLFSISPSLLGLTLFALGNSIGDIVSNIAFANLGLVMTGLGACFGGPLLYILIGIGANGIIVMAQQGETEMVFEVSRSLVISGGGLFVVLIFYMIAVPLNCWVVDRKIGIVAVGWWGAVTFYNVMCEIW
ncbi:hypothetical protein DASC09_040690 [Saccharomycopsis crataegensis]|uniref:Sodium/calcium exchanger membrane region domain-containing protein n=1 Tax=Saccharomycopsis crataegensis TaxID=43959 RepID=A0AAV5QPT5_9ASCO|nr:hypothetical protein DASC09_040690 [Saccharomycopsis crataegensis]